MVDVCHDEAPIGFWQLKSKEVEPVSYDGSVQDVGEPLVFFFYQMWFLEGVVG